MPSDIHERIESMARMAVLGDAGDLAGLVALQEQAMLLRGDLEASGSMEAARLACRIAELTEAIVLRTTADALGTFGEVRKLVEELQKPAQDAGKPGEADGELISAWIGRCETMLSELEGLFLSLERSPSDAEVIGEIRRTMHTLKGECGVLSLPVPQRLCHEAESLIDVRTGDGRNVPIDPFLDLLGWMKAYVARLSKDMSAAPPAHEAVLATLLAAQQAGPDGNLPPAEPPKDPAVSAGAGESTACDAPMGEGAGHLTFGVQAGTEENLADFLCEARDHIAGSEEALLALEHDRENKELINTVFRAFHTIKGVSGFMALAPIVSLAHRAEYLLDGARSGTIVLGRDMLGLVLSSCDMMTRLLAVLEGKQGPTHAEYQRLLSALDDATKSGDAPPSPGADKPQGLTGYDRPTPAAARPECAGQPTPANSTPKAPEGPAPEGGDNASTLRARKAEQTVKVSTSRMDSLVTMVGELVIAQQMVMQDLTGDGAAAQRTQRTLAHMTKMIRDLQEVSMALRMVNLRGTFQKMVRLVRDISQKTGKQIQMVTEGDDVELDRNVVEAITDPLVHMIRNSCDHGVEPAEERRAADKPPVGRVSLRAYHAGGSIVIEVSDDGRGLRREKLLAKARSNGLISPDVQDESMSDHEVFSLIFMPGFSTAEKVTDISGRGVGMDVVRRNIEALRGKIEIRSTPGAGTTFLLRLPLTLAIIDGMVVRVGRERFVLPTLSIQQSFRPEGGDIHTAVGAGEMVKIRGAMLPIYRLKRVLRLRDGLEEMTDGLLIVMETHDARFCLMVDEILGQQQVVIKSLAQTGQSLRGVSGGAILGDGRVALILDIDQLATLSRESTPRARRNSGESLPVPLAA